MAQLFGTRPPNSVVESGHGNPGGAHHHPLPFSNHGWEQWHDEIVATTTTHKWTVQQVNEIVKALAGLPTDSAQLLWQDYMERGNEFIRWNLHRKLRQQ
jgi:hypothetical protein